MKAIEDGKYLIRIEIWAPGEGADTQTPRTLELTDHVIDLKNQDPYQAVETIAKAVQEAIEDDDACGHVFYTSVGDRAICDDCGRDVTETLKERAEDADEDAGKRKYYHDKYGD